MSEIVLSMLRVRVLGLVIVVPRLACLACPRRKADVARAGLLALDGGDIGADPGVCGSTTFDDDMETFATAVSMIAFSPFGEDTGSEGSSGVVEDDRWGATLSGSTKWGGRRSFSISERRLK